MSRISKKVSLYRAMVPGLGISANFPAKLQVLFEPARYKVLYGGRGAAKSWGVARALLIRAAQSPIRVLCAREIQHSIKDSVHQLLADQVVNLGLGSCFQVLADEINGGNGSKFIFSGLRHNVDSIKSKEGLDVVWVEEAHRVSKNSWEKLIPTIRKEGSEIWITFNPELDTDETYKRFVADPPAGAKIVKLTYADNPWFPDVLRKEKDALQAKDPDAYLNVWEGHCRQTLDGAIYANEIRAATAEGRITHVPYNRAHPVHTFWDLGRAHMTAIWFVQTVGFEYHLIDYYENHGHGLDRYLKELQSREYVYGTDWLPHDADSKILAAEKTIKQQAEAIGRNVEIVPQIGIPNGINAAQTLFPNCWFDANRTADGLQALRHYQYKVDPKTGQRSKEPWHNWASHGADAFRYFAVSISEPKAKARERVRHFRRAGWQAA